MNIYGDYRICCKCKMKADVVERGKDYCADCWFKYFSGETLKKLLIGEGFEVKILEASFPLEIF